MFVGNKNYSGSQLARKLYAEKLKVTTKASISSRLNETYLMKTEQAYYKLQTVIML